jgi:phosphate/sulfate permease
MFSLVRQFGASAGTALVGSIVGAGAVAAGNAEAFGDTVRVATVWPLIAAALVLVASVLMADHPLRSLHEADDDPKLRPAPAVAAQRAATTRQ